MYNGNNFRKKPALIATGAVMVILAANIVYVGLMNGMGGQQGNALADVADVISSQFHTNSTTVTAVSAPKVAVRATSSVSESEKKSSTTAIADVTSSETLYSRSGPVPIATPSPTQTSASTPASTSQPKPQPQKNSSPTSHLPTPPPPVYDRTLPYSVGTFGNSFVDGDGWVELWGALAQTNGVLTVGANASGTGGAVLLSGSDNWNDYSFQATVDWLKGETFGLIADYKDPKDYLVCDFDEPTAGTVHMSIQRYMNGVDTYLATGDVNNYEQLGGYGLPVTIETKEDEAACSFDSHQIIAFDSGSGSPANVRSPRSGGIGFTTWDPNMDNSEIVIHNIGVVNGLYTY